MAERGKFRVNTQAPLDVQAQPVRIAPVSRTISPIEAAASQIGPAVSRIPIPEPAEEGGSRAVALWENIVQSTTQELDEAFERGVYSPREWEDARASARSAALRAINEYGFTKEERTELSNLMSADFGSEGRLRRSRVEREPLEGGAALLKIDGTPVGGGLQFSKEELVATQYTKMYEMFGSSVLGPLTSLAEGIITRDEINTLIDMQERTRAFDSIAAQNEELKQILTGAEDEQALLAQAASKKLPQVRSNIQKSVGLKLRELVNSVPAGELTPEAIEAAADEIINNALFSDSMAAFGSSLGGDRWNNFVTTMRQDLRQQAKTLITANDTLANLKYSTEVKAQTLDLIVQAVDMGLANQSPEAFHTLRNAGKLNSLAQAFSVGMLANVSNESLPGFLLYHMSRTEQQNTYESNLRLMDTVQDAEELETHVFDNLSSLVDNIKNVFPSSTTNPELEPVRAQYALEDLYRYITSRGVKRYIENQSIESEYRLGLVDKLKELENQLTTKSNLSSSQIEFLRDKYIVGDGTWEELRLKSQE
jgi:hypothetical protein